MGRNIKLSSDLGLLRIGAAVPALQVADVDFNITNIIELIKKAGKEGVQVLAFPEMAVTGYTIGDLVQHQALLSKAEEGLNAILKTSADLEMVLIVGLPLSIDQKVFNCAAVLNHGHILGVIPKTYVPSYKEFYEERWFASGRDANSDSVELAGQHVPFGTDILFSIRGIPSAIVGVEVCEDMWIPLSPHEYQS